MKKTSLTICLVLSFIASNSIAKAQDVIDATSLNNKIMAGYQGWFGAEGDGSGEGWLHWGGSPPNAESVTIDFWPDLREFDADELFNTGFNYKDNTIAGLYSAYTPKTVHRHVKWMKDYGIDGVFVQRFLASIKSQRELRDTVLQNIRRGAEMYGRVFANMYDVGGADSLTFAQEIINDWKHLVDDLKITESSNYLHHEGLPVLSIWGVNTGNTKAIQTPAEWLELLEWFASPTTEARYKVTLKAGVNNEWQSHSQEWQEVYDYFDIISPWSVSRYKDNSSADSFSEKNYATDLSTTQSKSMDYMPVVFPGFSWYNLKGAPYVLNAVPRNRGEFFWRQMYNVVNAGCKMIYVAMYDEVDEGTAIYKLAENVDQIPTTGSFVTLDADGQDIPNDWYLRLTGEAAKMLRGEIGITPKIPISTYPNSSRFISQDIPTNMQPGDTITIKLSMENAGTNSWTKAGNYKLGLISPPDSSLWGISRVELEAGETIAPADTKTFSFKITAPIAENIYQIQWKMTQEGSGWLGQNSKTQLINVGISNSFLDDCDATTGWNSSGTLSLINSGQKQGSACIEFNGTLNQTNEYRKVFSPAYNSGINEADAVLQFWYYTSDATKMGATNQVELGSGGTNDVDEYFWSLSDLTTGWNLISLKLSKAGKQGNPDLSNINWFRLYNNKTGVITTKIDDIQILDYNASLPRYTLSVNGGTGDGEYLEEYIVNISADEISEIQSFKQWVIEEGNPYIENPFQENTFLTMDAGNATVTAQYKVSGFYLDDCESLTDWKSSSSLTLNNIEFKEGENCIEFTGSGTDDFKKAFNIPYNSRISESDAVLQFWYYISNPAILSAQHQVELGSGGKADVNEYNWKITSLSTGWNLINLKTSEASKIGTPDLSAINWFRFYNAKTESITTRIDAIEIVNPNAGDKYILNIVNGSGSGFFYSGTTIPITANTPETGMEFDNWSINSGSPTITNINNASTTVTMPSSATTITATYKSIISGTDLITANKSSIKVYPNPLTGNTLYVEFINFDNPNKVELQIMNLLGQKVYSNTLISSGKIILDTQGLLRDSFYILTIKTGEIIYTTKLLIK